MTEADHTLDISVSCPACKVGKGKECVGADRRTLVLNGHSVVHYDRRLKRLSRAA